MERCDSCRETPENEDNPRVRVYSYLEDVGQSLGGSCADDAERYGAAVVGRLAGGDLGKGVRGGGRTLSGAAVARAPGDQGRTLRRTTGSSSPLSGR